MQRALQPAQLQAYQLSTLEEDDYVGRGYVKVPVSR